MEIKLEKKPMITLSHVSVRAADGTQVPLCPADLKEVCEAADGAGRAGGDCAGDEWIKNASGDCWSMCFEGDGCTADASLEDVDGLQILRLSGGFDTHKPRFGFQKRLHFSGGISASFDIGAGGAFMANYQHQEWWMRPMFGKCLKDVPAKTQLLIRKVSDAEKNADQQDAGQQNAGQQNAGDVRDASGEQYQVILAVFDGIRSDLQGGDGDNELKVLLSSNVSSASSMETVALICGQGKDPYDLTERMVALALEKTHNPMKLRRSNELPRPFEKLGWCTWDSLGHDVSLKAICEKMDEFAEKKVPVSWVLIDDGWEHADYENQELLGIDADEERFPGGLAAAISLIKEKYGVEMVGLWLAIKGYWNGITEGSEADRIFAKWTRKYPCGEITYRMEPEASFGFWNRYLEHLKDAGADFLKVDSQSSISLMLEGHVGYAEAEKAVHTGLEGAVGVYFGNRLINCMGMAPEDIWSRPSSVLSRSSDDYTPTVAGSFGEHALSNSYNSILHGCFYTGDWDMVWSRHEDAQRSILLRIIGGGPFYLSEGTGMTDPEALAPVLGEDGYLLRPENVGRPLLSCLTDGEVLKERPLIIYNRCKDAVYAAAFSDADKAICAGIRPESLPQDACRALGWNGEETKFLVYDWMKKKAFVCRSDEAVGISLEAKACGLIQLLPFDDVQIIGLTDKYISKAAIVREEKQTCADRTQIEVLCSASGRLGVFSVSDEISAFRGTQALEVTREDGFYTVDVEAGQTVRICVE